MPDFRNNRGKRYPLTAILALAIIVMMAGYGKTLCGSDKQGATLKCLLSVVSHQLGITRRQQPVAAKTNEIPIARQILQALDVSEKIVTTDCGNISQVMAVSLRNTVLTLLRISGYTQIAKALRFFAAQPWQALNIIQKQKLDN